MPNNYTCEVEVMINPRTGEVVLVEGSIEETITGVDDDGEPVRGQHVTAERVYLSHSDGYMTDPLLFTPLLWKNALIEAIQEKAFSDYEKAQENR